MLCQFSAKDAEISRLVEEMRNVQVLLHCCEQHEVE